MVVTSEEFTTMMVTSEEFTTMVVDECLGRQSLFELGPPGLKAECPLKEMKVSFCLILG